ncbi:Ppx/GppA phosphatase family protein [Klebsiella quasipneumoniae]|uniref:Ppx/GppA phosphatase family protein n=1 Tax=Klebsiella quasipneumoniae TaxID=1463165 RepID=UPI00387AC571
MGVEHTQPERGRKLVIDIGGGSTELVIGEDFEPRLVESRRMGCVSFSQPTSPAGPSIKKISSALARRRCKTGNPGPAVPYSGLDRGAGRLRYH